MPSKKLFLSSIIICVLLSFPIINSVWASSVMWSQTYESGRFQTAHSLVETSDGGYAIAGSSGFYQVEDFCLVKTDEYGTMQWSRTYGGPDLEKAYLLVETSDGGYAIAGDGLLVKTDVYGNMEWNQTYGGGSYYISNSLVETSDGGYVVAGGTRLIKTDAQGNMEWTQTYEIEMGIQQAFSLIETSDGGYALAGYIWAAISGTTVFWVVKTNAQGIPEFPSWLILPLFLTVTLVVAIFRRKLSKTGNPAFILGS